MIIELVIGAGVVALGAAAARVIARRRAASATPDEKKDAAPKKNGAKKDAPKKKKNEVVEELSEGPRGLRVDDVLLYADTEHWLAGVIELDEEGLVARLFPTPGAARASWVAQLDEQAHDLALLDPTSEVPAGPVPESLPIAGRRLTLERRGSADVRGEGEQLPRTGGRGTYAILSDAGGRVLIVLDFEKAPRLALCGDRVSRSAIDLLPGGDLDDEAPKSKKRKR